MSGTHISGVPTVSPGSNLTQGQVWGKGRCSAFLSGAVVLEMEGGGSCQQLLPDEERLDTELVGSPAPAGSEQLVLTWPQLRKELLLSQHLSGRGC